MWVGFIGCGGPVGPTPGTFQDGNETSDFITELVIMVKVIDSNTLMFNPLKLKLVSITLKNFLPTSKKILVHYKDQLVNTV